MKEGWDYKKLGEVAEIQYGTRVVQKRDGGSIYPVYGGGGATFKMDTYNREDCLVVARFAMSPKCTRIVSGKFFLNDSGLTLKSIDSNTLSQEYLEKNILGHNDEIYLLSNGMAQKNLDMKAFRNLLIKYPTSLSKQQRIVSELDLLSGVIEKQKAQLEELDKLAQSIFYDMFGDPVTNEKGWRKYKMNDLCEYIVDCPHSTPIKSKSITKYPCIRTSELKGGSISWDSMQYLEKDEYEKRITRLKPIAGDIVFGREGTIGDAVVLPEGYFFSLGQRTMLLRAKNELISNIYLHKTLMSEWIRKQISNVNVSSTVAHVNIKDFKFFDVPLPPLSLQQEFAAKIEAIETMKAKVRQSLKEAETLFNERMDYYFN